MKTIFIYILLLSCLSVSGQNMVFNPGFEKHERLPCNKVMLESHEYENVIWHWSNPSQATPDVWSRVTGKDCEFYAHTAPHSGEVMAGVKIYAPIMDGSPYAEYIQAALKQPLVPGKRYRVECWVSLDRDSDCAINRIGFYFSDKKIRSTTHGLLDALQPQVVITEIIKTAPGEWKKISGTFTADNNARYLLLGVFDKKISVLPTRQSGGDHIYYYIDDVALTILEEPGDDEPVLASARPSAGLPPPAAAAPSQPDIFNKPVLFALNTAVLSGSACSVLDEIAQLLQKTPDIKISIVGHTDREGAEEYNVRLSLRRAQAVKDYLVSRGITPDRLGCMGYGSSKPIEKTDEQSAINRRVIFSIKSD